MHSVRIKLFFSILLVSIVMVVFGQTVGPKKCKVCGKPFAQCQFKGKHTPIIKITPSTSSSQSSTTSSQSTSKPTNQSSAKPIKPSNSNVSSQPLGQSTPSPTYSNSVLTYNGVKYKMIRVEGGTFTMGATSEQGSDVDDDEKPVHQVTLSTFSIGETEVTQELWEAVMGSNPSMFKGSKRPVERVSWNDCQDFIKKLNVATGKSFRLPTEAEWEYAARGGNRSRGYKYAGSNNLGDVAWYLDNSGNTTHNVATKQSNELGLYDMSGNVWERISDWYGNYSSGIQASPKGANSGPHRVFRGGSWDSSAGGCRSSNRGYDPPDFRFNYLGLRLVLSE